MIWQKKSNYKQQWHRLWAVPIFSYSPLRKERKNKDARKLGGGVGGRQAGLLAPPGLTPFRTTHFFAPLSADYKKK